jgi:hypothetical protein
VELNRFLVDFTSAGNVQVDVRSKDHHGDLVADNPTRSADDDLESVCPQFCQLLCYERCWKLAEIEELIQWVQDTMY